MRTAAIVTTLSLGLLAAPCLMAQSDKDKPTSGDQSSGHHKTVEGVVAGVTAVGETMVDYQTGRALTAERDYLTIVAHSHHGEKDGEHGKNTEHASAGQPGSSAKQDKDVKQTADSSRGEHRGNAGTGGSSMRAADVYLIEVTPSTEVCECRDDGKKKCDLARLEIGDRVEVQYDPAETSGSGAGAGAQGQSTRHGRHRMMRGQAVSIAILHDKAHQGQGSKSSSGSHSSSNDQKSQQK